MKRLILVCVLSFCAAPLFAGSEKLDALFERLLVADDGGWRPIEDQIWEEWSQSGSASADFLLKRGRAALREEDWAVAIDHLTALVELAPEFAEGYNMRATAYYNAGLYGPSIEDIARTLLLEPRHFAALAGLASMFEEMNDPARAFEAYRRALAIHPHQPDLRQAVERLEPQVSGTDI
ncbi:MAG: tetratricopeptide repeat protein [Maritimibacter sp.]